jgi:hypothetical protein
MSTTPVLWLLVTLYFVAATLSIPLLYQLIPKHNATGGKPLIALLIGLSIWTFTGAMQLALPVEAAKLYYLKLGVLGGTLTPVAWFIFTVEYTQLDIPHKLKVYTGLTVTVALQNLIASTNELHELYWANTSLSTSASFPLLFVTYGPLFYVFTLFLGALAIAGVGIMFYYSATRGTTYQSHARLLGLSVSFIFVASVVSITKLGPYNGSLNVIPLGIMTAEFALIVAIYRFDLMDLSPAERDQLLYEQEGIHEAERLIESGSLDLPTTNIGDIAEETRTEFFEETEYTPGEDIEIIIDCDITAPANKALLKRLLRSLYENAVEHNTPPVEVHVSELAFEDGFAVDDDGKGIPDTQKDAVFDAGVTFDGHGSGNGLAVIDRIATGHRWGLELTDSAEGGCRFEFTNLNE